MYFAFIIVFFHTLVVIDIIKKTKNPQGKIKSIWLWISHFPVFGPIAYLSSANYNNKNASAKDIFFLILLYALLIELVATPFRAFSFTACSVVAFILYFLFINVVSRKYTFQLKIIYIFLACLLGCSILQLPFRIMNFSLSLISLPDFLFHLFGIVMGYLFYKSKRILRISILMVSLLCCFFLYFKGYGMWLNKLSFNTFTGIIDGDNRKYDLTFQTNSGDTLSLSDFEGKYLLLDCWYTYCGVCYQKMPEVQKLYDIYKEDERIVVSSMHCYIKDAEKLYKGENRKNENYATGFEILKEYNYTFPCYSINMDDPVIKELGISVYPTVLIFDKQSNLIFRGNIENAGKHIKKIIEKRD